MRVRDRICVGLGGSAMLVGVLAVGGVLRWAQVVVAGLVAVAFASQLLARRRLDRLSPLVAFLGIAAVLTAIQLIPLPPGVLHALDATGMQLRDEGAALTGTEPWQCISLDPPETLAALVFFTTLLAVALLALRYATTERGRFALLGSVAIAAGIAAVVAGIHTLLNADELYGVYKPHEFAHPPTVFGPLLNPNQLGGLMAVGAVVSLGLSFHNRQSTPWRVVWIVTGLVCTLVCAAAASRGAMVGLLIGIVVVGGLTIYSRVMSSRRSSSGRLRNDVPLLLVLGIGLITVLLASAGGVMSQLNDTSLVELNMPSSKYAAWRSSIELIKEAPMLGIGRGAEEVLLTRVFKGSAYYTYSHLENEYLEAIVDWGIGGGLLLVAAFLWCLRVAARRWRDGPLAAAALGSLSAIMFQAAVDFGLELYGLAIPVVIVAATVQLVPLKETAGSPVVLRARRLALVAVLGVLAIALAQPMARSLDEDHDDIDDTELPPPWQKLREVAERHPMDYVAFGELASQRFEHDNKESVAYLNHALALHPTHKALHRLAARLFVDDHLYAQASLEYALAMSADPTPLDLLTETIKVLPDVDDATNSIPADYPNVDIILRSLKELDREDVSEKWLARVARLPQHDTGIMDQLYDMAMDRKDYAEAKATAELRLETEHTTHSRMMLARAQYALKEYDAILANATDVATWTGSTTDRAAVWLIVCDVHKDRSEWDVAESCLHRLDVSGLLGQLDHGKITQRLQDIDEARTIESKMQQVEDMKKKYGAPETYKKMGAFDEPTMPKVLTRDSQQQKPQLGIPNPFDTLKPNGPAIPNPLDKPPQPMVGSAASPSPSLVPSFNPSLSPTKPKK